MNSNIYSKLGNDKINFTFKIVKSFIKIFFGSFIMTIAIISIIHFFGDWSVRYSPPEFNMNDKAVAYWLNCSFKKHHYTMVDGPIIADYVGGSHKVSVPKIKGSIKESFDNHSDVIGILWIVMLLLYYVVSIIHEHIKNISADMI